MSFSVDDAILGSPPATAGNDHEGENDGVGVAADAASPELRALRCPNKPSSTAGLFLRFKNPKRPDFVFFTEALPLSPFASTGSGTSVFSFLSALKGASFCLGIFIGTCGFNIGEIVGEDVALGVSTGVFERFKKDNHDRFLFSTVGGCVRGKSSIFFASTRDSILRRFSAAKGSSR